tara:strand:- start:806 stop:997 length:192 start_codon:yes stop_codon:yes gene_type:complete
VPGPGRRPMAVEWSDKSITKHERLELLHSQIQELINGTELTEYDLQVMLCIVEDIREDYIDAS